MPANALGSAFDRRAQGPGKRMSSGARLHELANGPARPPIGREPVWHAVIHLDKDEEPRVCEPRVVRTSVLERSSEVLFQHPRRGVSPTGVHDSSCHVPAEGLAADVDCDSVR